MNCRVIRDETGNVLITFALVFTVLIGFLSFATDVGMAYMKKARVNDIAQIGRLNDFTKNINSTDAIFSSSDPGKYMGDYLSYVAENNGFKGTLEVDFKMWIERDRRGNRKRRYKVIRTYRTSYKTFALRAFNINEIPIVVVSIGNGVRGQGSWAPTPDKMKFKHTYIIG